MGPASSDTCCEANYMLETLGKKIYYILLIKKENKKMEFLKLESSISNNRSKNYNNESQSAGNTNCRTPETLCLQSIEYIAGVIDGDGNFDIRVVNGVRKLKSIRIKLHIRDVRILAHVKKLLKCGKLYYKKHLVTYQIATHKEMYRVIHLLNGHIRLKIPGFLDACRYFQIPFESPNYNIKETQYLTGLIDTDGTVSFNFRSNRIELHLELKKNLYSEQLDLTNSIPGATVRTNKLVKRNQTRHKIFYSIRYSFDTVSNMIHLYNHFMKYRLYSDFKFYRISQIRSFLQIRHYQSSNKTSLEYKVYSKWVLNFISHMNPTYTKVSYYNKLIAF